MGYRISQRLEGDGSAQFRWADLDDVRSVAQQVLRHRVVTNCAAEAAERNSERLVTELLQSKDWNR
jgi:hypothetical protein